MRWCGKRLFTPACKARWPRIGADKTRAVRRLPGRSFFCFEEVFFCGAVEGVLLGIFAETVFLVWCFCGGVVVS